MTAPSPPESPTPDRHPGARAVQYKGAPLDPERGPGLGCFWLQLVVLAGAVVLTPLSVVWGWPDWTSAALLFLVVLLLLFAGQTVIFLLRLVAADRRAEGRRRRPMASATRTVGELEDEGAVAPSPITPEPEHATSLASNQDPGHQPSEPEGPMRQ